MMNPVAPVALVAPVAPVAPAAPERGAYVDLQTNRSATQLSFKVNFAFDASQTSHLSIKNFLFITTLL